MDRKSRSLVFACLAWLGSSACRAPERAQPASAPAAALRVQLEVGGVT